jgi:hypothetical protein
MLVRVTAARPCQHCGKPDYCYYSDNASLEVCGRKAIAAGWKETGKQDKNGHKYLMPIQVEDAGSKPEVPADATHYIYYDRITGLELVDVKIVYPSRDPKKRKDITQSYRNGKPKRGDIPVWQYSSVQESVKAGNTEVWIVEGEKGTLSVRALLEKTATTNIEGAGKWQDSDSEDLRGFKTAVICVDNDEPGYDHARKVAASLKRVLGDIEIKFLETPLAYKGADVADWIQLGATKEEIGRAVSSELSDKFLNQPTLPPADLETKSKVREVIKRLQQIEAMESPIDQVEHMIDLRRSSGFSQKEITEIALAAKSDLAMTDDEWCKTTKNFSTTKLNSGTWLLPGFMKLGRMLLLAAEAKTGKSLLHYDWSYCLATGTTWGNYTPDKAYNVLIVQTDEDAPDAQERVITRGLANQENIWIITEFTPQMMPRLKHMILKYSIEVLVLDSLLSILRHLGVSPNDPDYAYWVYDLKDFCSKHGVTPICITHTNKSPVEMGLDKIAGSYAIAASAGDILLLYYPKAPNNDLERSLQRLGGRSGGKKTWHLQLNIDNNSYSMLGEESGSAGEGNKGGTSARSKAQSRQEILDYLCKLSPQAYEAEEIATALGGVHNTVRQHLGEMFKDGVISRKPSVRDARAQAYFLPFTVTVESIEQLMLEGEEKEGEAF